MRTVFQLIENNIKPASGVKVIKSAEIGPLMQANDILEVAKAKASQMAEESAKIYEEQRLKGYEDGVIEGKIEHAEKIMETVLSSVEFIENIEKTLVDVVLSSIEKVVGDLNKDELIVGIVRKALNNVRSQQRITLRIAPADEKAVKEALASMIDAERGGVIDIFPDIRLKQSSCILESELGVIDASLDTQLEALRQAFNAKILADK